MNELTRHVGRVVFISRAEWVVLTLKCHVDNVTRLVEMWDAKAAYLPNAPDLTLTRHQAIRAAQIHDMAKPSHFRLTYTRGKFTDQAKWEYSFAGHRFGVEDDDLYVKLLGLLHHEYSVEGINKAIFQLRHFRSAADGTNPYQVIADHLPLDLYTLEMADQIEATVARATVGDEDPEERAFMDFLFRRVPAKVATYELDPFPFRTAPDPVVLMIEYAVLRPSIALINDVEEAKDDDRRRNGLRVVQEWLIKELQAAPIQSKEMILCPWS